MKSAFALEVKAEGEEVQISVGPLQEALSHCCKEDQVAEVVVVLLACQ